MTKVTSEKNAEEAYWETMEKLNKQIEDMDTTGLKPKEIFQYLTFRCIHRLEKSLRAMRTELATIHIDVELPLTELEALRNEVATMWTNLSTKIDAIEHLLKTLLQKMK